MPENLIQKLFIGWQSFEKWLWRLTNHFSKLLRRLTNHFSKPLWRLTNHFSRRLWRLTNHFSRTFTLIFSTYSADLKVKVVDIEFITFCMVFRRVISFIQVDMDSGHISITNIQFYLRNIGGHGLLVDMDLRCTLTLGWLGLCNVATIC